MLSNIKNKLIVSCQALEEEPLHGSEHMAKMALAAYQGGASGIRANTKEDIQAIKHEVPLPVIGIVKRDYPDSDVFITATKKEVDELIEAECDMIALDATSRKRPDQADLKSLIRYIREKSDIPIMGDISSVEEAKTAEQLKVDCVGTTLYGYTEDTYGKKIYDNNFSFLADILKEVTSPVIAEGNVLTPEMAKHCLELGAYSVVVGGAITRPQQITARFTSVIDTKQKV